MQQLAASGPVVVKPAADGSRVSVQQIDYLPQLLQAVAESHLGDAGFLVGPHLRAVGAPDGAGHR
ncbi:hypothetical protein ABZX95_36430 [Streptomyces sp. NPDC004232]|uniref:hypothetical protein n=1 Tax=Streptomyces sp. NPDC004232 TaxID=3154454 RepID=UPI0033B32C54